MPPGRITTYQEWEEEQRRKREEAARKTPTPPPDILRGPYQAPTRPIVPVAARAQPAAPVRPSTAPVPQNTPAPQRGYDPRFDDPEYGRTPKDSQRPTAVRPATATTAQADDRLPWRSPTPDVLRTPYQPPQRPLVPTTPQPRPGVQLNPDPQPRPGVVAPRPLLTPTTAPGGLAQRREGPLLPTGGYSPTPVDEAYLLHNRTRDWQGPRLPSGQMSPVNEEDRQALQGGLAWRRANPDYTPNVLAGLSRPSAQPGAPQMGASTTLSGSQLSAPTILPGAQGVSPSADYSLLSPVLRNPAIAAAAMQPQQLSSNPAFASYQDVAEQNRDAYRRGDDGLLTYGLKTAGNVLQLPFNLAMTMPLPVSGSSPAGRAMGLQPQEYGSLQAGQVLWPAVLAAGGAISTPGVQPTDFPRYMSNFMSEEWAKQNALNQAIDALPADQANAARIATTINYSGATDQQRAFDLIRQKHDANLFFAQARQLAAQGQTAQASQLWQYARDLQAQSYTDLAQSTPNPIWSFVANVVADPLNLLDAPISIATDALRAARVGGQLRRLESAAPAALDDVLAQGQRMLGLVKEGQPVMPPRSWLNQLVGRTPETQAQFAADSLLQSASQLYRGVDNAQDARIITEAWLNNPRSLVSGIQGLTGEIFRQGADPTTGAYRWGFGAVGMPNQLRAAPILQLAKDDLLASPALQPENFDPLQWLTTVDNAIYQAARKAYGLAPLEELPFGATKHAVAQRDGRYFVDFYDADGKRVGSSSPQPDLKSARQYQKNLDAALSAGARSPVLSGLRQMANVQRAFLSDMWLALRPTHWIRNAASATAATMGDGLYSFRQSDEIINDLSRKFAFGAPTQRIAQGIGPTAAPVVADDAERHITRNIWDKGNPYAAVVEAANKIWTGNTNILGLPFGEQSFYLKAFDRGFNRTFRQAWSDAVTRNLTPLYETLGIDQETGRAIANVLISAGVEGGRDDMQRAARAVVNARTIPFDVRNLGIPDELISAEGQRQLQQTINEWMNSSPTPEIMRPQAETSVRRIFAGERNRYGDMLRESPPQPGVYDWTRQEIADAGAEIIDAAVEAARASGADVQSAAAAGRQVAEQVQQAEVQALEQFLEEVRLSPANVDAMNVAFDLLSQLHTLKTQARRQVDGLSRAAADAMGDARPFAWQRKWQETAAIYNQYAVDAQAEINRALTDLRTILAGGQVEKRFDWWAALSRYFEYDEEANRAARAVQPGSTLDTDRQVWEKTIEANRQYLDQSFVQLYDAFRRFPSIEALDIVRWAQGQIDDTGARAAAYLAPLRDQAWENKLPWDRYFAARNAAWTQAFDNQVVLNEIAKRTIVSAGLGQGAGANNLRWSDDFAGSVYQLIGPGKTRPDGSPITWRAYDMERYKVEEFADKTGADSALPPVPQHIKDAYYRVTDQISRIKPTLDEIDQAHPATRPAGPPTTPAQPPTTPAPRPATPAPRPATPAAPQRLTQPPEYLTRPANWQSPQRAPLAIGSQVATPQGPGVITGEATSFYTVRLGNGKTTRFKRSNVQPVAHSAAPQAAPDVDFYEPAPSPQPLATSTRTGAVGRTVQAWSDPARPYDLRYEVVELDDLVASNLADGRVNPAYPTQLQPRDRTQAASRAQITTMANRLSPEELLADTNALDRGAPIIDAANNIESGNGRIMALRSAPPDRYSAYRSALQENAAAYDLDPAAFANMRQPVLVRRRITETDPAAFAAEANARATLAMNAAEQSRNLAKQITPTDLANFDQGEAAKLSEALAMRRNSEFVRRVFAKLPANERAAFVDPDGLLTAQGVDAIRSALFQTVLGNNPQLVRNYLLSPTPELANVANGIERAIGRLAALQLSNPQMSIADDLTVAAQTLLDVRGSGQSVEERLGQIGLFGDQMTPESAALLRFLDANVRSGKAIGDALNEYANAALKYQPGQAGLLADAQPSRMEILQRVLAAPPAPYTPGPFDAGLGIVAPGSEIFQNILRFFGKEKQTEIGDVAQHMIRTLNDAEDRIIAALPGLAQQPPNALNPAARNAIINAVDRLGPTFDNAVAVSRQAGQSLADAAMLNYKDRRGFDQILSLFFPYHYYWTRGGINWAKRLAKKPSWINLIQETNKLQQRQQQQADAPQRLDSYIPVGRVGDNLVAMGNPLNWILPRYMPNEFVDPEDGRTQAERYWLAIQQSTPGVLPLLAYGADAFFDWQSGAQGKERKAAANLRQFIPAAGVAADVVQATTGAVAPPGLGPGDPWDQYRVRTALAVTAQEGSLDPQIAQYAQQISYNLERGRPELDGVPPAYQTAARAAYTAAAQRSARQRLVTSATNFFAGNPLAIAPQAEIDLRRVGREYTAAGFDPVANPFGANTARRDVLQQNPALPTWWSRSATETNQPAVNAQRSQRWDALQNAVFGPMNQAVVQAIRANPNLTPAEVARIKAPYYDRIAAIDARFPLGQGSGNQRPPSGATPEERALYELQRMVEAAGGAPPAWPGDNATPDQLAAYRQAKASYDQRKLANIERNLNQVIVAVESDPSQPWMQELVNLVRGQYAVDIERKYDDLAYATPTERAWAEDAFFKQMARDAQWQDKQKQVGKRLGKPAVDVWTAYHQADDATRDLMRQDPGTRQALMAGYNPSQFDALIVEFGPNAWDIYFDPNYPKHPGDGAAKEQLDAYYAQRDAYEKTHPRSSELRFWINGRYRWSDEAATPVDFYDFGQDWRNARRIFGDDIFTIEAQANAAPDYGAWARSHQAAADRLAGFRQWKSALADIPQTLADLPRMGPAPAVQQPLASVPFRTAYTGPDPYANMTPIGATTTNGPDSRTYATAAPAPAIPPSTTAAPAPAIPLSTTAAPAPAIPPSTTAGIIDPYAGRTAAQWTATDPGVQQRAARLDAVQSAFGAPGLARFQEYASLPAGSDARAAYRRQHPEITLINLAAYDSENYTNLVDLWGQEALLAWANTPPDDQETRRQYLQANPVAWLVDAYIDGRPQPVDANAAPDRSRNYGADWRQAEQIFGADIWQTAYAYRTGDAQAKRQLRDATPIEQFFDWWYAALPDQEFARRGPVPTYVSRDGLITYDQYGRQLDSLGNVARGSFAMGRRSSWRAPYPPDVRPRYMLETLWYPSDLRAWRPQETNIDLSWLNAGQRLGPAPIVSWRPRQ